MKFLSVNGSIDILNLNFCENKKFQIFFTFCLKNSISIEFKKLFLLIVFYLQHMTQSSQIKIHIPLRESFTREAQVVVNVAVSTKLSSFCRQIFAVHCLSLKTKLLLFAKLKFKTGNCFVKMCKFILIICCFKEEGERERDVSGRYQVLDRYTTMIVAVFSSQPFHYTIC